MAWPVDALFESITAGVTTAKKTLADALQNAVIGIYGGGKTIKSLNVDGVGNAASALGAGNITAVGNVTAGTGYSLIGGTVVMNANRSSGTVGAGQSLGKATIYGDTTPFAWGHFTVNAGTLTFRRGVNISSVVRGSAGVFTVTLDTAASNYLIPVVTCMNPGSLLATIDCGTYPTTTTFIINTYSIGTTPTLTDPTNGGGGNGGVFFVVMQG